VRQIRILQVTRDGTIDKIKNVIGYDVASAELRDGTGGTNLLAAVDVLEQRNIIIGNAIGSDRRIYAYSESLPACESAVYKYSCARGHHCIGFI
jgi:hypothetical protein